MTYGVRYAEGDSAATLAVAGSRQSRPNLPGILALWPRPPE